MNTNPPQRRPHCFYCDTVLTDEQARIQLPGGQIYGPCCADIAPGDHSGDHR
jgi:hypothetical protein